MDSILTLVLVPILTGVVILIVEYWVIQPLKERRAKEQTKEDPIPPSKEYERFSPRPYKRKTLSKVRTFFDHPALTILSYIIVIVVLILSIYYYLNPPAPSIIDFIINGR